MRLEVAVKGAAVEGAFYAGKKRFRDYRRSYAKEGWSFWEMEGKDRVPILRFPFRAGHEWRARRGGREVAFRIEAEGAAVQTKAGRFQQCLKVRQQTVGEEAWVYEYFCPWVGRVKTSVGVPGAENPNTELSAYLVPGS